MSFFNLKSEVSLALIPFLNSFRTHTLSLRETLITLLWYPPLYCTLNVSYTKFLINQSNKKFRLKFQFRSTVASMRRPDLLKHA